MMIDYASRANEGAVLSLVRDDSTAYSFGRTSIVDLLKQKEAFFEKEVDKLQGKLEEFDKFYLAKRRHVEDMHYNADKELQRIKRRRVWASIKAAFGIGE